MFQILEWKTGVPPLCDRSDLFSLRSNPLLLLMQNRDGSSRFEFAEYIKFKDDEDEFPTEGKFQTLCASGFEITGEIILWAELSDDFYRDPSYQENLKRVFLQVSF